MKIRKLKSMIFPDHKCKYDFI